MQPLVIDQCQVENLALVVRLEGRPEEDLPVEAPAVDPLVEVLRLLVAFVALATVRMVTQLV